MITGFTPPRGGSSSGMFAETSRAMETTIFSVEAVLIPYQLKHRIYSFPQRQNAI